MPLANLTRGQPFKVALRMLAVFLLLFVLAGGLLIRAVTNSLSRELAAQAMGEATLLQDIYTTTGLPGLHSALDDLARTPLPERMVGLFDAQGVSLTGPISVLPDVVGVEKREMERLSGGRVKGRFFLALRRFDQVSLVVGRDARPVEIAQRRLLWGLLGFGGVLCLGVVGLGLWGSRISLKRLRAMENALAEYSAGDLGARLPVRGRDQFDVVSRQVNQNLARLSALVGGYRSTASAIAHDLKTPLSHAQIALHEAADAAEAGQEALPKIEAALQATQQLNTVFDTVLRISRIETQAHRAADPVDLGAVVRKVAGFLAPMAEERGQVLVSETATAGTIPGDGGMIEQALVNLVKNAVVHAGAGARITVGAQPLALYVSDTGPGVQVPEGDLTTLLEPFSRADAARTHEGNGLGLALVRAVAEHHRAGINLRNTHPGFAATLTFPSPS